MATVRIYRVAELLNTSSQEVMALLKRDHGIDVKSASSTIEEVVARQFVERLARQRNITVPSSASFADAPAAVRGKKPAGKAPEPQRPATPALPPPRLVKTAKPAAPPPDLEAEAATPSTASAPADIRDVAVVHEVPEPVAIPEPLAAVETPVAEAPVEAEEPVVAARVTEPVLEEPVETAPVAPRETPAPPRPVMPPSTGRVVPPTLRLRVEDPKTGQAPPAPPRRPGTRAPGSARGSSRLAGADRQFESAGGRRATVAADGSWCRCPPAAASRDVATEAGADGRPPAAPVSTRPARATAATRIDTRVSPAASTFWWRPSWWRSAP